MGGVAGYCARDRGTWSASPRIRASIECGVHNRHPAHVARVLRMGTWQRVVETSRGRAFAHRWNSDANARGRGCVDVRERSEGIHIRR